MDVNTLEISLLNSVPEIRYRGDLVQLNSKKAEALLIYIALTKERFFRRDFLAMLLWEDRDLKLARDNLRQTLARIKRTCGELRPAIEIQRSKILVDAKSVANDIQTLVLKITEQPEDLRPADLNFEFDRILAQFDEVGEAFSSWIHVARRTAEDNISQGLLGLLAKPNLDPNAGLMVANALLRIDPTNETAVRFKMQNLAFRGEPAVALRAYNELYDLLDREYDVEPAPETIDLNAAIKLGSFASANAPSNPIIHRPANDEPPQIFVSDFTVSNDPSKSKMLAQFFRSEVLSNLSRFREWSVVDFRPQGRDFYQLDCQIASRQDDIEAIVTVRRDADGRIVWSEHFITGYDNWRTTQWRIARQLALAINLSLSTDRLKSCLRERPEDRTTFDKWALCNGLNSQWSPDAMNTVISNLEEIAKTSPQFGLAHSHLAEYYNKRHLVYPGLFRSKESVAKALYHAKQSMVLDPLDTHTHRVLAWARTLNGEYDVAEFHFQQAFDLNPANLNVRISCALGFAFLDNLEKACSIADETRKMSVPLQPVHWAYMQNIYFLSGRLSDAKQAGDIADDAILNIPAWQATVLKEQGDIDGAERQKARFFELTRQNWHGEAEPDDQKILEWFAQCFPIKNTEKVEGLFRFMQRSPQPH
ncbi:DNA-binding SARP family transcriptional activator [Litoreibacter ponti]|uniref:DNA-binding SARP family transcriptional activator n=1 Tax=Litoreibacter ponti TaxID=1510457 RepID=A0A2T6BCR9_9RHOB|nr:BTAD domain-containing putative transcriptional regulator [Litoreibacter ponti]PTX53853.1 DNA-binding SARP family transcriptional activator [Litoreibacter ponti]